MKKTNVFIIVLISILLFSTFVTAETTNVKISINGTELKASKEGASFIDNQSRTMIPLRIISERLGHKVEWNNATRTASIDNKVHITIGKKVVKTSKGDIVMDTVAILKDSRTYVPLRFVVEALGYEVTYEGPKASNGHNHTVNIYKEGMTDTSAVKKISTESGIVEFSPTIDTYDWYGDIYIKDEKAYEIMKAYHDSFVYDEYDDYITLSFFEPYLPEGMSFITVVELVTKSGQYNAIYEASRGNKNSFQASRDKERVVVKFNTAVGDFKVKDIEQVLILSKIEYNGTTTASYVEEMKTGRVAKRGEFLFTEEEINNVEKLYLPKYRK